MGRRVYNLPDAFQAGTGRWPHLIGHGDGVSDVSGPVAADRGDLRRGTRTA